MNINLPTPPVNYTSQSFILIFETIKRALLPAISKDEAAPRILLQSPDGKVWQVEINNSGVLTTAVNDGKSRL